MTDKRSTSWALTINNPTATDREQIANARSRGWFVEGQVEKADTTGTIHLQLHLKTPHCRFGAVKKMFPRAHIEVARNVPALVNYVHKEETRVAELDEGDKFPSMGRFLVLLLKEEYVRKPWDNKDGFHCDALEKGQLCYYSDYVPDERCGFRDPEEWLELLDDGTEALVLKGYHVERYAVNPQFRSSFKKFGPAMLKRAFDEWLDEIRQTSTADADAVARLEVPVVPPAGEHNPDAVCPQAPSLQQAQVDPSPLPCSDPIRHASGGTCSCHPYL